MGDLERLFLGTMVLTGLLILFMFGLVFDIGDIVAGSFVGHSLGFGQEAADIRQSQRGSFLDQEDRRVAKAPRKAPGGSGGGGGPSARRWEKVLRRQRRISRQQLLDREVRRLQRKGFVDEEYIRMKSIYKVDRSLVPVMDRYDQQMDGGDYEGAIATLVDALEHLEEENILGKRDLLRHLYQAYILAGQDDEAARRLTELTEVHEYVVAVEERAEIHKDTAAQAYVKQMREQLGQIRESIQTAQAEGMPLQTFEAIRRQKKGEAIEMDGNLLRQVRLKVEESGLSEEAKQQLLSQYQGVSREEFAEKFGQR